MLKLNLGTKQLAMRLADLNVVSNLVCRAAELVSSEPWGPVDRGYMG
jgi:hypothetical protein